MYFKYLECFFFILCLKISIERTNRNVCLLTHCSLCRVFNEVPATTKKQKQYFNTHSQISWLLDFWFLFSLYNRIFGLKYEIKSECSMRSAMFDLNDSMLFRWYYTIYMQYMFVINLLANRISFSDSRYCCCHS